MQRCFIRSNNYLADCMNRDNPKLILNLIWNRFSKSLAWYNLSRNRSGQVPFDHMIDGLMMTSLSEAGIFFNPKNLGTLILTRLQFEIDLDTTSKSKTDPTY